MEDKFAFEDKHYCHARSVQMLRSSMCACVCVSQNVSVRVCGVSVCLLCLLWWLFLWGSWVLALVMGMDGMTICFPFTTIAIATRGRTYQASIHPDFWVFDRSWGQLVPDHEIRS